MKTININLIGDLGKTLKINRSRVKKAHSEEAKNQLIAYVLIIGVLMVFAASVGGWLLVRTMTANLDKKLIKLNNSLNLLKEQETQLSDFRQNLNKEKVITEFKIVVQKQLNDSFFPWSSVLQEIAAKIPKEIIVQKIEKSKGSESSKSKTNLPKLKISGMVSANKKPAPIVAVSLFIFNLNEKPDSLLSNAKITKLQFNDKTQAYEFEIETSIRPLNTLVSITPSSST